MTEGEIYLTVFTFSWILAAGWWVWFLTCKVGAPGWENKKEYTILPHCIWGGPVMWAAFFLFAAAIVYHRVRYGYWK